MNEKKKRNRRQRRFTVEQFSISDGTWVELAGGSDFETTDAARKWAVRQDTAGQYRVIAVTDEFTIEVVTTTKTLVHEGIDNELSAMPAVAAVGE